MKVAAVLGSPHGLSGNTGRLLGHVIEGAQKQGGQVEIVLLDGDNVRPCRGCDSCHSMGVCPQKDSFEAIQQRLMDVDGLILASPNYIFNVSAQMKAFMDRCCGAIHCLSFEGKYGISVVTSGGDNDEAIVEYLNRFLLVTGTLPVGSVHATMASFPKGQFPTGLIAEARTLGTHLVAAWENGAIDPVMQEAMETVRERMRQLIVYRQNEWPYEFGYWQDHHGLA